MNFPSSVACGQRLVVACRSVKPRHLRECWDKPQENLRTCKLGNAVSSMKLSTVQLRPRRRLCLIPLFASKHMENCMGMRKGCDRGILITSLPLQVMRNRWHTNDIVCDDVDKMLQTVI